MIPAPAPVAEVVPRNLPLLLEPRAARDADALPAWVSSNRAWLRDQVVHHGAVRLRGFDVGTPEAFEQVATAFATNLQDEYLGTTPREVLGGRVHTSTELPGYYLIPQHCEMSFLPDPPRWLFFCCLQEPGQGGETPLIDFRTVWRDLDADVRQRFLDGGIRTVRNYDGPASRGLDPWKTKRWDDMFGTTDRAAVEAKAAQTGMTAQWHGDRLRLITEQSPIRTHPDTGEDVWHNHLVVFHPTVAASEYAQLYRRRRDPRDGALSLFGRAAMAYRRRTTEADALPTNVTYLDGSPIPDADVEHVRDTVWRHLVADPWHRGDVVIIDNLSVGHGRRPYRGPRTIAVCWA